MAMTAALINYFLLIKLYLFSRGLNKAIPYSSTWEVEAVWLANWILAMHLPGRSVVALHSAVYPELCHVSYDEYILRLTGITVTLAPGYGLW